MRLPADADRTPAPREHTNGREPALAAMEMAELRRRLDALERRQNDFDRTLTVIQQDTGETGHMRASISFDRLDRLMERADAPANQAEPPPREEPSYRQAEAPPRGAALSS